MPKTGVEPFHNCGVPVGRNLLDFWRWSSSDLVGNALRGILAEFIVSSALNLSQESRVEWEAFDLITPNGLKLEVKSAAYLQSWSQNAPSKIRFGIAPTHAWDEAANCHSRDIRRQADVYVFCLLHHQDKTTVDPLDMTQWTFYVLPASALNKSCPAQQSIGLVGLLRLKPLECAYKELADAILGTQ